MAAGLSLVQLNPASLTDFSVQPESNRLGDTTILTIQMKVSVEVSCAQDRTGCSATVSAPVRNPYTSSVNRDTIFDESVLSCQIIDDVSIL